MRYNKNFNTNLPEKSNISAKYGIERMPNVSTSDAIEQVLDSISMITVPELDDFHKSTVSREGDHASFGVFKSISYDVLPSPLDLGLSVDMDNDEKDIERAINIALDWLEKIDGDDSDYVPFQAYHMFCKYIIDLLGIKGANLSWKHFFSTTDGSIYQPLDINAPGFSMSLTLYFCSYRLKDDVPNYEAFWSSPKNAFLLTVEPNDTGSSMTGLAGQNKSLGIYKVTLNLAKNETGEPRKVKFNVLLKDPNYSFTKLITFTINQAYLKKGFLFEIIDKTTSRISDIYNPDEVFNLNAITNSNSNNEITPGKDVKVNFLIINDNELVPLLASKFDFKINNQKARLNYLDTNTKKDISLPGNWLTLSSKATSLETVSGINNDDLLKTGPSSTKSPSTLHGTFSAYQPKEGTSHYSPEIKMHGLDIVADVSLEYNYNGSTKKISSEFKLKNPDRLTKVGDASDERLGTNKKYINYYTGKTTNYIDVRYFSSECSPTKLEYTISLFNNDVSRESMNTASYEVFMSGISEPQITGKCKRIFQYGEIPTGSYEAVNFSIDANNGESFIYDKSGFWTGDNYIYGKIWFSEVHWKSVSPETIYVFSQYTPKNCNFLLWAPYKLDGTSFDLDSLFKVREFSDFEEGLFEESFKKTYGVEFDTSSSTKFPNDAPIYYMDIDFNTEFTQSEDKTRYTKNIITYLPRYYIGGSTSSDDSYTKININNGSTNKVYGTSYEKYLGDTKKQYNEGFWRVSLTLVIETDESGNPIKENRVCIAKMKGEPKLNTINAFTKSNVPIYQGKIFTNSLALTINGGNSLFTKKTDEGYNCYWWLYHASLGNLFPLSHMTYMGDYCISMYFNIIYPD